MITAETMSRYSGTLDALCAAAEAFVSSGVEAYIRAHPDSTVAERRRAAAELLTKAVATYGDSAATAAADLAETVWGGGPVEAAWLRWEDVEAEASRIAHYQAGKLVDGDTAGFVAQMARSAASQVLSRANASVPAAAARGGEAAKYARVLRGPEPCGWCFKLAAEGFEYTSAEAASHSHRGCRCVVVPGDSDLAIEGYDLVGIKARYHQIEAACGEGASTETIVRFAELHDPGWLYDGTIPEIDERYVTLEEMRGTSDEVNIPTIELMRDRGFKVTPRPLQAVGPDGVVMDGVTNPDIFIDVSDGKEVWEIKHRNRGNPGKNENGKLTFVTNAFKSAGKNFRNVYDADNKSGGGLVKDRRVVLDLGAHHFNASVKELDKVVTNEMKNYRVSEVIVVMPDGSFRFYR